MTWGTQVARASKNLATQMGLVSGALGRQQRMASKVQEILMGRASLAQETGSELVSSPLEMQKGKAPKVQGKLLKLVILVMRLKEVPMFLGSVSISGFWD